MEKKFQGELGEYELIITDDQTLTLKSAYFDEACHSLAGARAETLHNYLIPCQILELFTQKMLTPVTLLEVGFGLGMGLKTTLEYLYQHFDTLPRPLHYVALELDPKLPKLAQELSPLPRGPFPALDQLQAREFGLEASGEGHQLTLLIGNATETLPRFQQKNPGFCFDAIFQDPFSPKKNPDLWTLDWFKLLHGLGHEDSRLSTYSASQSVRKAMLLAGFRVQKLKGFAQKKEATLALWSGPTDPELEKLAQNPRIAPY